MRTRQPYFVGGREKQRAGNIIACHNPKTTDSGMSFIEFHPTDAGTNEKQITAVKTIIRAQSTGLIFSLPLSLGYRKIKTDIDNH